MGNYAFQKSHRPGPRREPSSPRGRLPEGESSPWIALVGFVGLCLTGIVPGPSSLARGRLTRGPGSDCAPHPQCCTVTDDGVGR